MDDFSKHSGRPSGRQANCRKCDSDRRKGRNQVRDCAACGASFTAISGRATCTERCRQTLAMNTHRVNGTQPGYVAGDGLLARHRGCRADGQPLGEGVTGVPSRSERALAALSRAAKGTRGGHTFVCGPCRVCGVVFTHRKQPGKQMEYRQACSEPCTRELNRRSNARGGQRYRARKRAVFVEDVDVLVVADRAGWVCGICGQHIDRNLKWPNVGSLSLDHVKPISRGGFHCYANCQPAHFFCNSSKSNRDSASSVYVKNVVVR